MTDRHAGYVVTLARDVREDDAEVICSAIEQIRGVVSVKAVVAEIGIAIAEERARTRLLEQLLDVVKSRP
jgi:hypothetical protein